MSMVPCPGAWVEECVRKVEADAAESEGAGVSGV
jgi:hypothetical protein